ncbi:MAG: hypothetical protein LAP13_21625 [Acidobacteriia bacterium]|nr:hypothetical protein [Terriglobia bacterium]
MPGAGSHRTPDGIRHLAFDDEMPSMERVLASARLFLAIAFLVAIYLDPTTPTRYVTLAYVLLIAYVIYSCCLFVPILLHKHAIFRRPFILGVHAVDLFWPALLSLFTEGAESPFYLFFFFVVMAGFWETVATTAAAISLLLMELSVVSGGPADTGHLLQGAFELNRFMMRITYLFLMGLLMGFLGEEERRLRIQASAVARIIAKAQAERGLTNTLRAVLNKILQLFGADEVLLVVSEARTGRTFFWQTRRESGESDRTIQFSELGPLQREKYLFPIPCHSLRATRGRSAGQADLFRVIALDDKGRRMQNRSCTFPEDFTSAHAFRSVLVVSVAFEDEWSGRLLVFKPDDVIFKERELLFLQTLVQSVAPALHSAYLSGRLRSRAGALERARVARELHDGVIQFLTSLGLHMEAVRRQTPAAPPRMIQELSRIQQSLSAEVANLRDLLQRVRPLDLGPERLLDFMKETVNRFQLETGVSASFTSDLRDVNLPPRVCREFGRIIQEALVNVRKHSGARNVHVHLTSEDRCWKLVVNDDGRGFDFSGRLSHAELPAQQEGPRIIKERVISLRGELTIESTPGAGARLEITIPQQAYG